MSTPQATIRGILAVIVCWAASAGSEERPLLVSFGDHIVVYDAAVDERLDRPEKIARCMRRWRDEHGVTTVYWRTGVWFIRERCRPLRTSIAKYWSAVDDIYRRFDPYHAAAASAHQAGLRMFAYATIFDEGSPPTVLYGDNTPFPWQSRFTIEHPEYLVTDRTGKRRQYGVMEYAYPQVRHYKLRELTEFLDQYDYDGVYLCTRSHSKPAERADEFGFNDPVVAAFRQRHGVDIRTQPFDVAAWRALRGEFLTQFLREVRVELNRRGKGLAIGVPQGDILGPPFGNMKLDWRSWVREHLIDRLVVGIYSGDWHYPSMRGKDRERGYLASGHEHWGLPPADEAMRTVYGPYCRKYGVAVQLGILNAASLAGLPAYGATRAIPKLSFPGGRVTVSAWIKLAGKPDYGRLVSQYDHTLPDDAGRGWEVYIQPDGKVVFRLNDGERDFTVTTQRAMEVNRWTHLVCVSEGAGGHLRAWFDGVADGNQAPAPGRIRQAPVRVFIGRYPAGGRPLNAWVAQVRVSRGTSRTLKSAQAGGDEDALLSWQPARPSSIVRNGAALPAPLQLVNARQWGAGPQPGLVAVHLGIAPTEVH